METEEGDEGQEAVMRCMLSLGIVNGVNVMDRITGFWDHCLSLMKMSMFCVCSVQVELMKCALEKGYVFCLLVCLVSISTC